MYGTAASAAASAAFWTRFISSYQREVSELMARLAIRKPLAIRHATRMVM